MPAPQQPTQAGKPIRGQKKLGSHAVFGNGGGSVDSNNGVELKLDDRHEWRS
ncbi:hypothetical protein TRAPUB_3322 [Trametes pubescens]|uniref:Uncharacterized protein n=1 Tax=Trametes pubescens TaxID=154538 RepID=A0A1M2VE55_TRAPU|nr:hypothetical protein TRAPUB_3322 [Trametes pubescens]